MKTIWLVLVLLSVSVLGAANDYPIRPIPFTQVKVHDAFWRARIDTVLRVTIPHAFKQSEETGRISNFMKAAGLIDGNFEGDFGFNDSDVYKVIEGAAYSLALAYDPELDAYLDRIIGYIAAAQEEDGYLYTAWTTRARETNPNIYCCYIEKRWDNLRSSHELYNLGHLYEAAVAHYQATGKRTLLDVALKSADLLCETFGFDKLPDYSGHQEVEIGLAKLYRVTGNENYLNLAKYFLDARGSGYRTYKDSGLAWELATYAQDHKPVVEQDEAIGHAVRAVYMYSAMADVAALTGDAAYIKAIDRIWENVVKSKLYVTGGIGDMPEGEAFGPSYHLPNATAYCETCASIANVFWNQRMFLLHGDAAYIDVLERTLYNALLSGISMDGRTFFYPNVLETTGDERSPWFGCACCPSNLARFIPSLPGYIYAQKDGELYVNLFIESRTTVELNGVPTVVSLSGRYPWEGRIALRIEPKKATNFALKVRIPGWAVDQPVPSDLYQFMPAESEAVNLRLNGKPIAFTRDKGYAVITRRWRKGDVVELDLPMPVRRVSAHEAVADDRGKTALQRGPLVFCVEEADNGPVLGMLLPDDVELTTCFAKDLLGGVQIIRGTVPTVRITEEGRAVTTESKTMTAIPYYAWAHRGKGEMTVWLPRRISKVVIVP